MCLGVCCCCPNLDISGPSSTNVGRNAPKFGPHRRNHGTNTDEFWSNIAKLGPNSARNDQTLAQHRPVSADFGLNLGSQSKGSTTLGQLVGNFGAIAKLAGITGASFREHCEQLSVTSRQFSHLCRSRFRRRGRHRNARSHLGAPGGELKESLVGCRLWGSPVTGPSDRRCVARCVAPAAVA